jgi:hypothetical protein
MEKERDNKRRKRLKVEGELGVHSVSIPLARKLLYVCGKHKGSFYEKRHRTAVAK